MLEYPFDAPIGDEPDKRHQGIDRAGDARVDQREQDADDKEHGRDLPFEVTAERLRQRRVVTLRPYLHEVGEPVPSLAHNRVVIRATAGYPTVRATSRKSSDPMRPP